MKKFSVIQFFIASLLATQALAGTLTVNGSLTVTTNLTAQSITLGGVTETNWAASLSGGYKYVVVAEGTNDTHRGNNLRTAYTTATTLSPTSSNRVAVIVPPGTYNLGTAGLVMNTSYVDLIGLVPAQMTTKQVLTNIAGSVITETTSNVQCSVHISSGAITQTVDNIHIESMSLQGYNPTVAGTNTVLRHVSMASMGGSEYAGVYVDCVGGDNGFTGDTDSGLFIDCVGGFGGGASGTFIGCTGGDASFASSGTASGTFTDCVGGNDSFGGDTGSASGSFTRCLGGVDSFGGDGLANGWFTACVGGDSSFGGYRGDTGVASGTFINCVGGGGSFGGGTSLDSAAKLQHCKGGSGSFGGFGVASDDFNYNVGGANTFLMLPQLPTTTNGLPSGTVYNSSGTLKIMP